MIEIKTNVEADGYALVEGVLTEAQMGALDAALDMRTGGATTGRNLLDVVEVRAGAASGAVRGIVEPVLGAACFPVRALLFDKTPGANWKVPWHQDLSVAVRERRDAPGFGPWTVKDGVPHALAPGEVLAGMLAVRLHLDDCGPNNGPVRVLPGTHCLGRLPADVVPAMAAGREGTVCAVNRGGALLMRPLLLHTSSASESPARRRVIHIEFASIALPGGLEWYYAGLGGVE